MRRLLPLLLLLHFPAGADPIVDKTKARVAQLNKIPEASNAYGQLKSLLLAKESPVKATISALPPLLSFWPEPKTTLDKIMESKTFDRDRAAFEKLMPQVEPALKLPFFYAKQDFHQEIIPNWMGLRSYCLSQNVLAIYLASQGQGQRALELLGQCLTTANHLSGNGILIQQMISLAISNSTSETLLQLLQTQPKLPLKSLQGLRRQPVLARADMALSLDVETACNFTQASERDAKVAARYAAFCAKWRAKVEKLEPGSSWNSAYLKERDALMGSDLMFMGLDQIDYTKLVEQWRGGLERRAWVNQLLDLEIERQQKGRYPARLTGPHLKYTSDGKSYRLESSSPIWKPGPRIFQSPK